MILFDLASTGLHKCNSGQAYEALQMSWHCDIMCNILCLICYVFNWTWVWSLTNSIYGSDSRFNCMNTHDNVFDIEKFVLNIMYAYK